METPITKKNKTRKIWSDNDTNIFIDIWRDFIGDFRKAKRNGHIMIEMAKRLENDGQIKVNPSEVLNKLNNLTRRYR